MDWDSEDSLKGSVRIYLVTGPTGSGKTDLIHMINPTRVVEYESPFVTVSRVFIALETFTYIPNPVVVVESQRYPDDLVNGLKEVAKAANASFRHIRIES